MLLNMVIEDIIIFNFIISVLGLIVVWNFTILYAYKIKVLKSRLKGHMRYFFKILLKFNIVMAILESGLFISIILDFFSGSIASAISIKFWLPSFMVILSIILFTLGAKILITINSLIEEKRYD